jgi:hypothetical protein
MPMTDVPYPYTVQVLPSAKPAGHFDWMIRKHGKLVERSDRPQTSQEAARKRAISAIDRQFLDR